MKQVIKVQEIEGEGLTAFLGKRITLFCMNYIYTGDLVGVNSTFVKLENAAVVYATGDFKEKSWSDSQKLPSEWYVQTNAIESFGFLKA